MRSFSSFAASQNGSVSRSGVGRSNRIAVIGTCCSTATRESRGGDARELGLTGLVRDGALEVDALLAALRVLLFDLDVRREDLARPRLLREADLVEAQVADADVVRERLGEDAGGEHP